MHNYALLRNLIPVLVVKTGSRQKNIPSSVDLATPLVKLSPIGLLLFKFSAFKFPVTIE